MLVLSRRTNQVIVINGDIRIMVVEIKDGKVRLGIDAPAHISVDRQEIHDIKRSGKVRPASDMLDEGGGK